MIPEKTVGKLRQGWDSICFLLAPWWKYGKTLMVGSFISSVLFVPAAGYFSATLAQAVIEMIEAGKPFEAAFLTGLTYLLLALALDLLHAVYEDFYLRWKKQEIEGTIERSIYEKALMVDYRHFDDPSYFDSYKLTTEKFASQSSETLQNLFSLLSGVAKCIVYGALIASQGIALLLIVLGCSAFVAYAQIYWSRVSVERETAMVNDQRKADYLRRLFFDHTAVADLARVKHQKAAFFAVRRLCEEQGRDLSKIRRKGISDRYSGEPRAAPARRLPVPVYVAWGVMSGNIGGIGVYATLIASSLALKEALNALGWWSSQVALGVAYAQKVQRFFDTDSTIEASTDGEKASDGPVSVRFDHVSYRYGGSDEFAIRDLSLAIAPGEKIAIVGENGAGKTTLTKLLLRLYDADGGTVQINGRPIADYDVSTLRGRIGIAFQQSRLYALSVRENMTAYADADDARLKSALRRSAAAFSGRAGHEGVRRKRRGALGRRRAAPMPDAAAAQQIWAAHPRRAVQRAGSDRRVPHRKADLRPLADDHRYGRAPALHGRGREPNLSSLRWKNHRIRHARGADGAERKISGNVFKAGRRVLESLAEVWYNKSKFFLSREGSLPALLK